MKRFILFIGILLASVSLVFANIYKKYDVRSGLSGNCVRSILQDSIGYMWFATQDGLNPVSYTHLTLPTICSV